MTPRASAVAGWLAVAAVLALAPGLPARGVGQRVTVEPVIAHAGEYVTKFAEAFSNVVAEERYTQEVSGATPAVRRILRSDVLLLKIGGPLEWRPYRDVFEVDSRPVHDRDDRLMSLFQQPSATSFEQAARIARESARFNIGLAGRTINTPMLSLLFLQPSIQPRFRFKLGKADSALGPRVWTVEYREEARPTIIRGLMTDANTDLPASGRFWIDVESGRVSKAELLFAVIGMRASLTTSFRRDDRLGVDVPAEMHEVYRLQRQVTEIGPTDKADGAPRVSQILEETIVSGIAIYTNFRQFEVRANTDIAPAKP
jgi:hypothetical protein